MLMCSLLPTYELKVLAGDIAVLWIAMAGDIAVLWIAMAGDIAVLWVAMAGDIAVLWIAIHDYHLRRGI